MSWPARGARVFASARVRGSVRVWKYERPATRRGPPAGVDHVRVLVVVCDLWRTGWRYDQPLLAGHRPKCADGIAHRLRHWHCCRGCRAANALASASRSALGRARSVVGRNLCEAPRAAEAAPPNWPTRSASPAGASPPTYTSTKGIRVNSVAPTFIDTDFTRPMFENKKFKETVLSNIAMGQLGTLEDVAAAVIFLASDNAAMITGDSLKVDGGWTAW